jgi:hypothetical protein
MENPGLMISILKVLSQNNFGVSYIKNKIGSIIKNNFPEILFLLLQ